MSNLEILESGVKFTTEFYKKSFQDKVVRGELSEGELQTEALRYSSSVLLTVLTESPEYWSKAYTHTNNLRNDMISLSKDDIKNELLKNVVNVASYNFLNDTRDSNYMEFSVDTNSMSDDAIAVIISNNLLCNKEGEESVYKMLDDLNILKSVCRTFVKYKTDSNKKEILNNIAITDVRAKELNDALDVYYARNDSKKILK